MTPEMGFLLAQLLLKYGPEYALAIVNLLHKADPTPADWITLLSNPPIYEQLAPAIPDDPLPVPPALAPTAPVG